MRKIVAIYQNFTGGVVNAENTSLLPDNCLTRAENVVLNALGGLTSRKGSSNFNSVTYGAVNVTRLIEWPRKDGSKVLLAMAGYTLAKIAEDGAKTDLKALDASDIGHYFLQDKLYFAGIEGGVDKYWYYDGTTVAEVTPNAAPDNDLAPIKRCRLFMWHSKSFRIFAAGDRNDLSCLYYSEPNDPTYFKNTSKLYPTTGDGPVTALALFGEGLLSFYQNSIWTYKGSNPATDATWSKLPTAIGTVSPDTIAMAPSSLIFLSSGGIYSLSPGILDYNIVLVAGEGLISNIAENKRQQTIKDILYREKACGVFYDDRYYLVYSYDQADWTKRKIIVYDWNLKAFTDFTNWNALSFCSRANSDLLFGTTGGYIRRAFSGYNDAGVDIPVAITTKRYDLGSANYGVSRGSVTPWHTKKLKRLLVGIKTAISAPQITIKVTGDLSEGSSLVTAIATGYLVWGDVWGEVWGWPESHLTEFKTNLKARSFFAELSFSTSTDTVIILGLGFEFKVKRIKVD